MEDAVHEYYQKMLKTSQVPPLLEETYNQAKMLSDRLDGGMFNGRELSIIAVLAGCDPFAEQGVEPPRDLDFVASATPTENNDVEPWEEGAPVEVDWHGKKEGTFIRMVGDKVRVKLTKDGSVRDMRPSRVKMLTHS